MTMSGPSGPLFILEQGFCRLDVASLTCRENQKGYPAGVNQGLGTGKKSDMALKRMHLFTMLTLVCVFIPGMLFANPAQQILDSQKNVLVRFSYTDAKAKTVCLAGSFNQWSSQADCMNKSGDTWSLALFLSPGRHSYAFVIDGQTLKEDPTAVLSEESGFGIRNSVIIIE